MPPRNIGIIEFQRVYQAHDEVTIEPTGEAPMPPRPATPPPAPNIPGAAIGRTASLATISDTMTKFGLTDHDWNKLSTPCKLALSEAAGVLVNGIDPNTEFVPGMYVVMGSDQDGCNYENLVAASNRTEAIRQFCRYNDIEDWDSGPYAYSIPMRPAGRDGVQHWTEARE